MTERFKATPLRVINEVGHAWGVRMGTRLQHHTCSHVNSPLSFRARGSHCCPFGSSTTAGPPRKQPSCRSCESPVVVSESKSPQYQQGTYISERISDSHWNCTSKCLAFQRLLSGNQPWLAGKSSIYKEFSS